MEDAFNIKVSRTTQTQRKEGKPVSKERLETGDLVFFQTGNTTWHVGIYLQDGQFMHASVTYGVSVSDINNTYWKRRYKGARRIDFSS
jgi:cell wall-associated NlpC family hydrolase